MRQLTFKYFNAHKLIIFVQGDVLKMSKGSEVERIMSRLKVVRVILVVISSYITIELVEDVDAEIQFV